MTTGLNIRRIKEFILASLGAQALDIELTDAHLHECIRVAVETLSFEYGGRESYYQFTTNDSQDLYELPKNILYVSDIIYSPRLQNQLNQYVYIYQEVFLYRGDISLNRFYQVSEWLEKRNRLLGIQTRWEMLDGNNIRLYPIPGQNDVVILKYIPNFGLGANINIENEEEVEAEIGKGISQKEPWYTYWIQRFALAHGKEILGRIRSKYSTLKVGDDTVTLDGAKLVEESQKDKEALRNELLSYGEPLPFMLG